MRAIPPRYLLLSALSGGGWGLVAWLLWPRVSAPSPLAAVVVSPVIGIVIGVAFRWIHRARPRARVIASLASLYTGASLFGLAVGAADLVRLRSSGATQVMASEIVLQAVPAVWWGLTFTGYVIVLWPLAYWNHRLLERASDGEPRTPRPGHLLGSRDGSGARAAG